MGMTAASPPGAAEHGAGTSDVPSPAPRLASSPAQGMKLGPNLLCILLTGRARRSHRHRAEPLAPCSAPEPLSSPSSGKGSLPSLLLLSCSERNPPA